MVNQSLAYSQRRQKNTKARAAAGCSVSSEHCTSSTLNPWEPHHEASIFKNQAHIFQLQGKSKRHSVTIHDIESPANPHRIDARAFGNPKSPDFSPDGTVGSPFNREFNIQSYPKDFSGREIEVETANWVYLACPTSPIMCRDCMNHSSHVDCLVVAIGTLLPAHPEPGANITFGVYFGHENYHNTAAKVSAPHCTAQVAALEACFAALCRCSVIQLSWQYDLNASADAKGKTWPLRCIVIKSDSEYLVKGATDWLPKWKSNGWKNCKGQPVANEAMWRLIDGMVCRLEERVTVKFWLATKEINHKANTMVSLIDQIR